MIDSADDAVKAVRFKLKHDARVIKIVATAGAMSTGETVGAQQMSDAEMKAAVDVSAAAGGAPVVSSLVD